MEDARWTKHHPETPAFHERRSVIPDDMFDVVDPSVRLPYRKGHAFMEALRRGSKASSSVRRRERKGSSRRSLFAEVVPTVEVERCALERGAVAACIIHHAPEHACIKDVPRSIVDDRCDGRIVIHEGVFATCMRLRAPSFGAILVWHHKPLTMAKKKAAKKKAAPKKAAAKKASAKKSAPKKKAAKKK